MAYIGRAPSIGTFTKQDLTGDGSTTTFTLTNTVGSESAILVSVGGVIQEPKVAYTLGTGGTQIIFTTAPSSTDNVYIHFLGNSVTQNLNNIRGSEFILDADGDTSLTADTDDEVDIKVGGTDRSTIKTTGFHNIDSYKYVAGTGDDLEIYHDGTNSFIANKTGALKIATETSGIAVTIGHTTSEVTVADNMTVAGDLTVTGTANFGDTNITNVGSITLDTVIDDGGTITLDSSGDIVLDAAGNDIFFKAGGTTIGEFENESNNLIIKSSVSDADLIIRGNDGGSEISALTFDMSAGGAATFVSTVTAAGFTIGNAVIGEAELEILDGLAATTAELAVIDGDTSATSTTVADADRVVMNDNGTMVQVAVTDLAAYFDDEITAMPNLTSVGTLGTLTVDDITINGSTISDAGDFTLDVEGDITLDANGGDILLKDDGNEIGKFDFDGSNLKIASSQSNKDIIFQGNDAGSAITALTLDMSDGGTATFNHDIVLADDNIVKFGDSGELHIYHHNNGTSFIQETGSGNLEILASNFKVLNAAGTENKIAATTDGAVDLYHNNIKKFETTATGIDITGGFNATVGSTITTADNTDTLSLISTDDDAASGPNLRLYRNSSSPEDSNVFGQIDFEGRNDNSQDFVATQIKVAAGDVSDGTEDAQIEFDVMTNGTLREYLRLAAGSNPAVIINQDSQDINFQVLSDSNDNMLFVDGGTNRVGIADAPDLGVGLHIKSADSGASVDGGADELVIEGSANTGMSILSGASNTGSIYFGDSGLNYDGYIAYSQANRGFSFGTAGGAKLAISSTGVLTHTGGTATSTSDLTTGGIHFHDSSTSAGDIMPITFTPSATANRARAGIGFISQSQDGSAGFAADIAFYTRGAADGSTLGTDDERMRIIKGGNVLIGQTSTPASNAGLGIASTTSNDSASMYIDTYASNQSQSTLFIRASKNSTVGTKTETVSGQDLGSVYFQGVNSSSAFGYGANITATQTGSAGSSKIPTALIFGTSTNSALSEAMRIFSSGTVSIGTTDAHGKLTVMTANSGAGANGDADELQLEGSGNAGMTICSGTSSSGNIHFADVGAANRGIITYDHSADEMKFGTGGTIRARINSSGEFMVGKSSSGIANAGVEMFTDKLSATVSAATIMYLNRLSNDGTLAQFHQAGTEEGSISVSGSTVSYNGFTGSHWSRLADNSKPTILRGTIMDSIDEMCDWYQAVANVAEVKYTAEDPETQNTLYTANDSETQDVLYTSMDPETQNVLYTEGDTIPDGKSVGDVKTAATKSVGDVKEPARKSVGDMRYTATKNVGDVKEAAYTVKESITLPDGKSVGDAVTFTSDGTEYTGVYEKEDDVKHTKSKISDTADSKKVYGVFSNWDDADDGLDGDVNDMNIAQVGTYLVRVHKDVTVEAGDLLVSNGDGTAKVQDDDIIRSKTVAKVNSTIKIETYSDGSYTIPCTLHC